MKPVILCYSYTGKTSQLCSHIGKLHSIPVYAVHEKKRHTKMGAYLKGSFAALRGRAYPVVLPQHADVKQADLLIIAGPVWAGHPCPAINGILRTLNIRGRRVAGLLTADSDFGTSRQNMKEEIERNGGIVADVLTLVTDDMSGLKENLLSGILESTAAPSP